MKEISNIPNKYRYRVYWMIEVDGRSEPLYTSTPIENKTVAEKMYENVLNFADENREIRFIELACVDLHTRETIRKCMWGV